MKKFTVFINDESVFEFDKESRLEEQQLKFLDSMDSDMDGGIKIRGEAITEPNKAHRAMFVVMNLVKALQQNNEASIQASCAYLVNRQPALIEARAYDYDGDVNFEFTHEH